MSERSHFSVEEKYSIILDIIEESQSVNGAAKKYSVSFTTIMNWLRKYDDNGLEGLKKSVKWNRYNSEVKQATILAVIEDAISLYQATKVF